MARNTNGPVQLYRGTTAKNNAYTGAEGEITVDTDVNGLVVHDGSTAGGHRILPPDGVTIDEESGRLTVQTDDIMLDRSIQTTLTSALSVYVATDGVDDYTETGRGLSSSKPFATLQYAVNYVSRFYNLGTVGASIYLAAGDYGTSAIQLPFYNSGTGRLRIYGASNTDASQTIVGHINVYNPSIYYLYHLTARPSSNMVAIRSYMGHLFLYNIRIDTTAIDTSLIRYGIVGYRSANIMIPATNTTWNGGVTFVVDDAMTYHSLLYGHGTGVALSMTQDVTVEGSCTMNRGMVTMTNGASFRAYNTGSYTNPGRMPVITLTDGSTLTGSRYYCAKQSLIDVSGCGEEYIPGTKDGVVEDGGLYV